MKKLLLFVVILCGFAVLPHNADAKCTLLSCGDTSFFDPNAWLTADIGGNQCWFCGPGPNSCSDDEVVPYLDGVGDVVGLYQCSTGFTNKFVNYEPGHFCKDSELQSGSGLGGISLINAKKTYRIDGVATTSFSLGDLEAFIGRASCIYVKCNSGYMPNAAKTECIADNREQRCVDSGGTWTGSACTCDSAKNLRLVSGGGACECISSDYEFDATAKQCNKKQSVIDEENRRRREEENNRLNQQRKVACENSGGVWTGGACTCDSAKNLRVENNVCVCLDDVNYVRNGDRCDLTDAAALQQKCTSQASIASGAYWDDVNKQCRCTNQQYSWNGSVCAMNPAIQKCLLITGANWNYTTGQCYCMEVGKTFNPEGTACVDATTSGGSASSTTTVTTDQQAAARERIESTVSKLDDIASGLKLTVWRNEEGNFNTSRLLSDSIAGVVLGTAGGLITSNVVKKNQVENGFEDIQCTIGGQVVAGWGDEFRVGIQ